MKLHDTYLPFNEETVKKHFIEIPDAKTSNVENHLNGYKKSIVKYQTYENTKTSCSRTDYRSLRQIEKDEQFWTISAFLTLYYANDSKSQFVEILKNAYGHKPPLSNFTTWEECVKGDLKLYFEPNLSSPESYREYLHKGHAGKHLIPYILEKAEDNEGNYRTNLEGATNVDALLINPDNGFAVLIEAKVLSDISYDITYDMNRNQIIRNIDVMLDENQNLNYPLDKRKSKNTLFLMCVPEVFIKNKTARLYGYKFQDYTTNPETIKQDLPHRNLSNEEADSLSKRIGITSWEALKRINSDCCKWL